LTDAEQNAAKEAAHQAGAGVVRIIQEPLAAAIGAGRRSTSPWAT
jgi:actin-like ATPase involved in cell morphogenesis